MCATGLAAQTQESQTTTKTKTEIKGGKNVTAIGCLERGPDGAYLLHQVRHDNRGEYLRDALVTSQDLSKHVGERVEIKGKSVKDGDGKVTVELEDREDRGRGRQGHGIEDEDRGHQRHVRPPVPPARRDPLKTL